MKMKSFLIPALALALAGCANEELETIGSGTIPAVPSGQTILFSNNTALTIGDADGVQTRAMGWTEVTDKVNSQAMMCTLNPAKKRFIIGFWEKWTGTFSCTVRWC